ncbi:MAG: hypothetical protein RRY29_00440 [Desulfovibrionaceae bacterium]
MQDKNITIPIRAFALRGAARVVILISTCNMGEAYESCTVGKNSYAHDRYYADYPMIITYMPEVPLFFLSNK